MDNTIQFPTKPHNPLEFIVGPFEEYRVEVQGRMIPRLTAWKTDEGVNLIVDGRYCVCVPENMGSDLAWLLANALAVGEGYASLSAETKERPFAPRSYEIGVETE
jgi:hypothetical protein